jgi:hypothetical protein
VLTRPREVSIVRPPFGQFDKFLEQIPSKSLIFRKVDPRPVLSMSRTSRQTGTCCRSLKRPQSSPLRKDVSMKRLSLLLVALSVFISSSGCCCGWLHGCNSCCGYPSSSCGSCGYAPAYPAAPACPTCGPAYGGGCPTCPGGGCGVQGLPPGAYLDNGIIRTGAISSPTPATASVAAVELPTY